MRSILFCTLICFSGALFSQDLTVSGDQAYELGLVYLATGQTDRARQYFDRAVADASNADLARLEILKLEIEKDAQDSRIQELILQAEDNYRPVLYRQAVLSLLRRVDFDPKQRDRAMAWLLDFPVLFEKSQSAPDMKYLAASILEREGFEEASLRILHSILDRSGNSEVADDAIILMARIYSKPGEFQSIQTARRLLIYFRNRMIDSSTFSNSVHADAVLKHRIDADPLELFSFYP